MASVKFDAFVEDVLEGERGPWALRTSEPHRRKRDDGQWETTARTFRTVKVSRESGVQLSAFVKGDRVTITGTEKTEKRDKDGRTFYDLIVWADSIERLQSVTAPSEQPAAEWSAPQPAAGYDTDVPF